MRYCPPKSYAVRFGVAVPNKEPLTYVFKYVPSHVICILIHSPLVIVIEEPYAQLLLTDKKDPKNGPLLVPLTE